MKAHGVAITIESEVDAFTEFVVTLPRRISEDGGGQGYPASWPTAVVGL
jgi:hypothetical protein